jgi:positive regulator of sigma E activity
VALKVISLLVIFISAILLFYSFDKELAQWAFFLLFQLIAYYALCFFLEARPKRAISPLILLLFYFFFLGKFLYNEDFLHEPARLLALVSGACIIFLCFRKRGRVGFIFAFIFLPVQV